MTISAFSYTDANKFIKNHTTKVWHQHWSKHTTKLKEIKNLILPWPLPSDFSTREKTINRFRIGHIPITHRHLMTRNDPPKCLTWCVLLTIKYVLNECRNHKKYREETLGSTYLYDILSPDLIAIVNLFTFLKIFNLYNEI